MLKWIVVALLIASGAQAQNYSAQLCGSAFGPCFEESPQHPEMGRSFTIAVDIDTILEQGNSGFRSAWFGVPYNPEEVRLLTATRLWPDMETPIACSDKWLHPSYGAPEDRTRMAFCAFQDHFWNSGPEDKLVEAPEILLHFQLLAPTATIGGGRFSTWEWNGSDHEVFAESGMIENEVHVVPEPGALLGLGAGLIALCVLPRRRGPYVR